MPIDSVETRYNDEKIVLYIVGNDAVFKEPKIGNHTVMTSC